MECQAGVLIVSAEIYLLSREPRYLIITAILAVATSNKLSPSGEPTLQVGSLADIHQASRLQAQSLPDPKIDANMCSKERNHITRSPARSHKNIEEAFAEC